MLIRADYEVEDSLDLSRSKTGPGDVQLPNPAESLSRQVPWERRQVIVADVEQVQLLDVTEQGGALLSCEVGSVKVNLLEIGKECYIQLLSAFQPPPILPKRTHVGVHIKFFFGGHFRKIIYITSWYLKNS